MFSRKTGVPKYLDKQHFTLFGRFYYILAEKLEVDSVTVARMAGFNTSTISTTTRDGKNDPSPETIRLYIKAFQAIALEKGVPWDGQWTVKLWHAAGRATPEEIEATEKEVAAEAAQLFAEKYTHR